MIILHSGYRISHSIFGVNVNFILVVMVQELNITSCHRSLLISFLFFKSFFRQFWWYEKLFSCQKDDITEYMITVPFYRLQRIIEHVPYLGNFIARAKTYATSWLVLMSLDRFFYCIDLCTVTVSPRPLTVDFDVVCDPILPVNQKERNRWALV